MIFQKTKNAHSAGFVAAAGLAGALWVGGQAAVARLGRGAAAVWADVWEAAGTLATAPPFGRARGEPQTCGTGECGRIQFHFP